MPSPLGLSILPRDNLPENKVSPMKLVVSAAALACVVTSLAVGTAPAGAQGSPELRNSQVETVYVEPKDASFAPIYERLKKRRVLEQLEQFLSPLRLPRKLQVKIDQCGAPFSDYKPGGAVTICYEYIDQIEKLAPGGSVLLGSAWITTRDDALVGAVVITVLHEVAHAVFDILKIPVWGREDDAADKVAGFIVLQFGKEVGWRTITGVAWFLSQAADNSKVNYADIRSATTQRFYNILCVAYGSDTKTFGFLSPRNSGSTVYLPAQRAEGCEDEYAKLKFGFDKTILPNVDPELLKKVQSMEWLK
jgi:hypothetical protein